MSFYRARLATLLLSLFLMTVSCRGDLRDPAGLEGSPDRPGGGGSTGGGTGGQPGTGTSPLLGTWQTVIIFQLDTDVQRHTTTWTFGSGGICHRTVEVFSVLEDQTFLNDSDCTFRAGANDVTITYAGNTSSVTFQWMLVNFSRDKLLLDGITYNRIN